jgi:electron transport complex protein RnfC
MYEALKYDKVIDRRIVTISGDRIKNPMNVTLRIGTNIKDIYKEFDLKEEESIKFVAGGPMMGRALPNYDLIVTPNLNSVLFIDDYEEKIINPCFRCGKCIDVCPVDIVPVLIKDNVNKKKNLKNMHPEKCIECGLCSYICPSNIDVRSYVKKAKRSV